MYAKGLTVQYLKDNQPAESKIAGWSNHATFDEIYLENGDIIVDSQVIAIKEDYEANQLINFRKISLFLAGNTESIRSNSIPKKYQKAVSELEGIVRDWIKKYS